MWLDELDQTVRALADRIKQHERTLRGNEQATRYALIDPLLTTLGWNLADPSEVVAEYPLEGRRVDYAMLYDGEPYLLVEAKKLGDQLSRATDQVAQYAMVAGVRFVVLTNGRRWMGYSLGKVGDKQVFEFNVTAPKVLELLWLWHGNFKGRTTRPNLHEQSDDVTVSISTTRPVASSGRRTLAIVGVSLPDVNYTKGMRNPRRLVFPDGEEKDVSKSWSSIQLATAEWLIDHKHVTNLPLCNSRGTYLMHKEPKKKNGSRFTRGKEVRDDHWIDMDLVIVQHLKRATELLSVCNVDPNTVRLEL